MRELNIAERRIDSVVILDLQGGITIGEGNVALRQAVRALIENGETKILLNAAGITAIDSRGVDELISSHRTAQRSGGDLKFVNPSRYLQEILMISKLMTVFDIYEDERQAVESFS